MTLFSGDRLILSLCDHSGNWPKFYREAGYDVRCVDLKHGQDVRLLPYVSDKPVHGMLIATPCTAFTVSGAQYWPAKDGDGRTLEGKAIADACLALVAIYQPVWWAMENPIGRLPRWYGPYRHKFDPCDYAGWLDDPSADAYTKKTCLWGRFNIPQPKPVAPVRVCSQGSWLMKLGGASERTKELRSVTPLGFAKAFYHANP